MQSGCAHHGAGRLDSTAAGFGNGHGAGSRSGSGRLSGGYPMETRGSNGSGGCVDVADWLASPKALSEGAGNHVSSSRGRPQRIGLPDFAVENCRRLRRILGKGTRPWQPKPTRFRSGTLFGFYSRGAGRGVGFCWSICNAGAVHGVAATPDPERATRKGSRGNVSGDGCGGDTWFPCAR